MYAFLLPSLLHLLFCVIVLVPCEVFFPLLDTYKYTEKTESVEVAFKSETIAIWNHQGFFFCFLGLFFCCVVVF